MSTAVTTQAKKLASPVNPSTPEPTDSRAAALTAIAASQPPDDPAHAPNSTVALARTALPEQVLLEPLASSTRGDRETFACTSRRCLEKRERRHKEGARSLFSAEWRAMKIGTTKVWVVDVTLVCPECNTKQSRTLIPPALVTTMPGGGV